MTATVSLSRAAAGAVLLALLAASGCSWLHRGNKLYAQSPAERPLEVPPELDLSQANTGATALGATLAATQQRAAAVGFAMAASKDDAFKRVGEALAAVPGVTITSRAELLGAYDVNYQGASFLVRVGATDAGAYVSAVDPRGQAASGDAPRKLIETLQAALASR